MSETRIITGHTGIMFIVADPIEHVKTPQRLNEFMARRGYDAVLVPLHARASDLAQLITGLRGVHNLLGLIVTVPHKISILDYCDELDPTALRVGAANVVQRRPDGLFVGANFDGKGFLQSIEDAFGPAKGHSVYIAGAGGVARSIAFSFAQAGASRIAIFNRSKDKAAALIDALLRDYPGIEIGVGGSEPDGFDIAVNATSLGLKSSDPLPFTIDKLAATTLVGEVVMEPLRTKLVAAAQMRGMRVVTGEVMLEHQLEQIVSFLGPRQVNGSAAPTSALAFETSGETR